MLPKADDIAYI